jgi:hypothetical protein
MARAQPESCRTTYRGVVPNAYLDGRERQMEFAGIPIAEMAYGWRDTTPLRNARNA